MQKNNPGQQSVRATTAGLAFVILLACATVQSQAGPPVAATHSNQEPLTLALARYEQAIEGKLYNEAADASKLYINALLQDPDFERREWANALIRLGHAQRYSSNYEQSIQNYELAIELLHSETDRLDASLIEPLLGTSEAMIAMREYDAAARVLEQVIHLQQVNNGLHDLSQGAPLETLRRIYLALGDPARALARQQANTSIYDQRYPGDDLRKLPALLAEADVLAQTGALVDSHFSYRRIIEMIENADGRRSPHLLTPFYQMSDLVANNKIMDGYDGGHMGRRYLQRAVYIAENGEHVSTLQRADAHIAMGDYLATQTLDRAAALRRYRAAWQMLAADEGLNAARDERFAVPSLLNDVPRNASPDMVNLIMKLTNYDAQPEARVTVRFDVDSRGTPHNIEVVEGDPTGRWNSLVRDHVRKFIYRPKLEDGEAREYRNMHWSIAYFVSNQDLQG